jgi:DNA-binding transcriptional LysR family regulator
MELRQLVYFDAVVRTGGFTRAAASLRIAQPAVSAQIRRLEAELGTPLLERTTRRVALTHAGELFWARVRHVLEHLDSGLSELAALSALEHGRVRVGATHIVGTLDLPPLMAGFRRRHPGIRLELHAGMVAELLERLDVGDLDVVLGPIHADLPGRFLAQPLLEEQVVLVTAVGLRASGTVRTLRSVRDEPFVCLPTGSGLSEILTAAAAAEGFAPRVEFETFSPGSIRELVAAGLGVALLAAGAATGPGPAVDVHRLDRPPPHPPLGIIRSRQHAAAPALVAFQDFVAERVSEARLPATAAGVTGGSPA